jgi:hypothetical protein
MPAAILPRQAEEPEEMVLPVLEEQGELRLLPGPATPVAAVGPAVQPARQALEDQGMILIASLVLAAAVVALAARPRLERLLTSTATVGNMAAEVVGPDASERPLPQYPVALAQQD